MDNTNLPAAITPEQAQLTSAVVQQMMGPLVEAMAKLLENNTNALNQLAAAQQVQADRLEALERQIRLNTPVTRQQARYLSAAMKEHALEALDKYSISDAKAVNKLVKAIKKDVLADYGITVLEEIPKHEYNVAMHNIKTWNNMRIVRDVVKEARMREEAEKEPVGGLELFAGSHGKVAVLPQDHQPDQ